MEIDYTNAEDVKEIILHSKLSKFIIHRAGYSRNNAPVYEYIANGNNTDCVNAFMKWAKITHNSNAYEMWLFDEFDAPKESTEESGNKRKKNKLMKFVFTLQKTSPLSEDPKSVINYAPAPAPANTEEIIEKVLAKMLKAQAEDQTNLRIKSLEDKLDAVLNGDDDDDDDEEDEDEAQTNKQLFLLNKLESFLERSNILKPKEAVAINGDEEDKQSLNAEKIALINKAIVTLAKNDKNIVKHLSLFAKLSEEKPEIYKMAIDHLTKL